MGALRAGLKAVSDAMVATRLLQNVGTVEYVVTALCTHCHTLRSLINGSLIEGFCAQFTFDTLFAFAGLGEKFSTASLYFDHGM